MSVLDELVKAGIYQEGTPLKLHLGAGTTYLDGYINIDLPPDAHSVMTPNVDAYADIVLDLHFPENSVDEIRLHHVFEHFPRVTAIAQLIKWHIWLKPGGILTIEVPDFVRTIDQFAVADFAWRMQLIRHLVGDQSASWGFHVDQWWEERFVLLLPRFGYTIWRTSQANWQHFPFLASVLVESRITEKLQFDQLCEAGRSVLRMSLVSDREEATYQVWVKKLEEEARNE